MFNSNEQQIEILELDANNPTHKRTDMDILTILLIVLAVAVVAIVGLALVRRRQRSGSVLAAPDSADGAGGQS